jgi:hypothetical protein
LDLVRALTEHEQSTDRAQVECTDLGYSRISNMAIKEVDGVYDQKYDGISFWCHSKKVNSDCAHDPFFKETRIKHHHIFIIHAIHFFICHSSSRQQALNKTLV